MYHFSSKVASNTDNASGWPWRAEVTVRKGDVCLTLGKGFEAEKDAYAWVKVMDEAYKATDITITLPAMKLA